MAVSDAAKSALANQEGIAKGTLDTVRSWMQAGGQGSPFPALRTREDFDAFYAQSAPTDEALRTKHEAGRKVFETMLNTATNKLNEFSQGSAGHATWSEHIARYQQSLQEHIDKKIPDARSRIADMATALEEQHAANPALADAVAAAAINNLTDPRLVQAIDQASRDLGFKPGNVYGAMAEAVTTPIDPRLSPDEMRFVRASQATQNRVVAHAQSGGFSSAVVSAIHKAKGEGFTR